VTLWLKGFISYETGPNVWKDFPHSVWRIPERSVERTSSGTKGMLPRRGSPM
jgi:hypothetical protein